MANHSRHIALTTWASGGAVIASVTEAVSNVSPMSVGASLVAAFALALSLYREYKLSRERLLSGRVAINEEEIADLKNLVSALEGRNSALERDLAAERDRALATEEKRLEVTRENLKLSHALLIQANILSPSGDARPPRRPETPS